MQFLSNLKKAAKGEREEEFSFDDDAEKGKADKWLEKINKYSKKIQSAPAAAREKLQKMREPKDEEKAAYFEEAAQEKAKSANWWSGCDPKDDPDVKQWSRSASSETLQSHAAGESVTSGDESWFEEEDQSEDEKEAEQKGQVRMSQIDFESLQNGGAVSVKPMDTIAEAAEPEPPEPKAKEAPPAAAAPAKAPPVEAAKDPFDSSGDEGAAAAPAAPVKAEEAKKGPKKGKKPVKSKVAPVASTNLPAKDPFADSDEDTAGAGYPAKDAKAPAPAKSADPFADSDEDTGPLLPSTPVEATMRRPSQVPQRRSETSKSQSSSGVDAPKKVRKPKGRPDGSKAEDGTASSSSKKPVGRPKKKAAAAVAPAAAAQDSDGEDAKF